MDKYNVEGGIDFYAELYQSLDDEESTNKTEDDLKLCLITNKPLTDYFVELKCGHKFNYIPLYLDIKNHKQKYNNMESSSGMLRCNEIRCPYCRNKQNEILPYYDALGLSKIHGVNFIDANVKSNKSPLNSNYKTCEFLIPNQSFDPSGNNPVDISTTGNCKFFMCAVVGTQIKYYDPDTENYGDEKYYCWTHKKCMIKKYKNEMKSNEIINKKKIKEEAKNLKLKEKEDAKQEKIKEKEEKKKKNTKSNVIVEQPDLDNIVLVENVCIEILKSGPNKNKQCGCKIFTENMCKRHFSLKQKIIINDL